jgi:hypothetical protein
MRPACHTCETREESAHSERALVATAPDSTRNLISLYFAGDDISDLELGYSDCNRTTLDTGYASSAFSCE